MKVLKWILIVVVAIPVLLVAGIYIRNKSVGPEGWAKDNTEKKLVASMKDPDSMVIRSYYFVKNTAANGDEEIYMCGIVDGKNSFGAYTGGTRFASRSTSSKSLNTFDTWDVQMDSEERKATASRLGRLSAFEEVYWNKWCVDSQHPPLTPTNG